MKDLDIKNLKNKLKIHPALKILITFIIFFTISFIINFNNTYMINAVCYENILINRIESAINCGFLGGCLLTMICLYLNLTYIWIKSKETWKKIISLFMITNIMLLLYLYVSLIRTFTNSLLLIL